MLHEALFATAVNCRAGAFEINNGDCQTYKTGSQIDMEYHHRVVTPNMPKMLVDVLVSFARPVLLIVVGRVLVNSQLTPALLMHMTYSNRLAWPQQWHTQTGCAGGQLLLYIQCGLLIRAHGC